MEIRQPKPERGAYSPNNHFSLRSLSYSLFFGQFTDFLSLADHGASNAALAATLTNALRTMLVHTSSERGRTAVPLITSSASISPFPLRIAVKVGGVEVG